MSQTGLEQWIPKQHRAFMKKCLLEEWNNECAYYNYLEKNRELTIDHITAICKGGDDSYYNQVPACRSCNLSKSNKPVRQWYFNSPNYTTERWLRIKQHITQQIRNAA